MCEWVVKRHFEKKVKQKIIKSYVLVLYFSSLMLASNLKGHHKTCFFWLYHTFRSLDPTSTLQKIQSAKKHGLSYCKKSLKNLSK